MTQTARIYGESLYELARDEGLGEEIFHQLQMVSALFRENPQYAELLAMPSLPKRERCGVLNQAFQDRVHPYLLNFLKILVEHGTIRQLSGCEAVYRQGYYEDNGILEVTVIGKLSDVYIPLSNFNITPFVGTIPEMPNFVLSKNEVEKVIIIPLKDLLNDKNKTSQVLYRQEQKIIAPGYKIGENFIWGATAMMIAELEAMVKNEQ